MAFVGSVNRPTRCPAAWWLRRATSTKRSKNFSSRGSRLNGTVILLMERWELTAIAGAPNIAARSGPCYVPFRGALAPRGGAAHIGERPEQTPKLHRAAAMETDATVEVTTSPADCPDCDAKLVQA